jgi:hypothetical protein
VAGADDREVPAVEGGDLLYVQALRGGDDRGIDAPEREVAIGAHELSDPQPFIDGDGFGNEVAGGEVTEKSDLCVGAEPGAEQIDDLGDDELRDEERARVRL